MEAFADQSWIAILLVRLALTRASLDGFSPYSRAIVPKLFLTLDCTPSMRQFSMGTLAVCFPSPEEAGDLGEGATSPPDPVSRGVYKHRRRQLNLSLAY